MRHLTKYSALSKGLFIPEGRKGRKVVVIDIRPTATSKQADEFIQVTPGKDFEIASVMRALIKGLPLQDLTEDSLVGGVPLSKWRELVDIMKACKYGVVMFGIGLTESRGKDINLEQINTLVGEMNEFTRFYAIPMRGHGNVNGSNQVLTWQTGYPFAVDLSHGYPRFSPGEFSVIDLLVRKEVDAALIIATDPGDHLPKSAVEHLKNIPTIVLEPHENLTTPWANVVIPVAPAGVGASGTFYRMDSVALHVKKLVDFPFPSDLEVVKSIKERITDVKDNQRASL